MTHYVCTRPFSWISMLDNGEVLCCCPPWLNHYSLGNLGKHSFEEIWNGTRAQQLRKSCLDGSFRFCNPKSCPHLQAKIFSVTTPDRIDHPLVKEDVRLGKLVLDHGPTEAHCTYDRSCNLACPSCRREIMIASGARKSQLLELQQKFMDTFIRDAWHISITGSGDAVGSPIFRHMLQTLTEKHAPRCNTIGLLTNGLLVKHYWNSFSPFVRERINSISVSIDATDKETYSINRFPGRWETLLENLDFIREQRIHGKLRYFRFSSVVQKNNFRQMIDFVKMAIHYRGDYVQFQILEPDFIRDLGYDNYFEQWSDKAVHEKSHPDHPALLNMLADPVFDELSQKIYIEFGPLFDLRKGLDISQFESVARENLDFKSGKRILPTRVNYSEALPL